MQDCGGILLENRCFCVRKPSVAVVFIYALILTTLALLLKEPHRILPLVVFNASMSLIVGWRKVWWLYFLILVASIGIFTNALFFANTGGTVLDTGFFVVRENALKGFVTVTLRVMLIAGVGAFFVALFEPLEIIKGFTRELRMPASISLSLSYALRLLPLLRKDLEEIMFSRKQRGYRKRPLTPGELSSTLTGLLIAGFERALWSGVSLELRGFRDYKPARGISLNLYDVLIIAALIAQLIYATIM